MKNVLKGLLTISLLIVIFGESCKKTIYETIVTRDTIFESSNKHDTDNGLILLSPYNAANTKDSGTLLVLDGNGKLLMQKRTANTAMDFKRWVINGQVRYTWQIYDFSSFAVPVPAYCVIADEHLNEIKRVSLLAYKDIVLDNDQGIDIHDFILLSDNHYITVSYYQKTVTNIPTNLAPSGSAVVIAPIIQEISNDQVIWQWDGTEYPEFYSSSVEGNLFQSGKPQDYMHLNSMFVDPRDNSIICSFRNLNQIVKISRTNGDILWRIGGRNSDFTLAEDQQFLRQHHATLTDNNQTLLIFDNGEATERPFTRIVEFQLNESEKQVTGFRSFNIPENFTQFTGSAQKFKNHYFIGGGTAKYYLDINYLSGEKSLEVKMDQPSYRTLKYY